MTSERRPQTTGRAPDPSTTAADNSGGASEPKSSSGVLSGPGAPPEGAAAPLEADGQPTEHLDASASTASLKEEQEGSEAAEGPADRATQIEHDLEEIL